MSLSTIAFVSEDKRCQERMALPVVVKEFAFIQLPFFVDGNGILVASAKPALWCGVYWLWVLFGRCDALHVRCWGPAGKIKGVRNLYLLFEACLGVLKYFPGLVVGLFFRSTLYLQTGRRAGYCVSVPVLRDQSDTG